MKWNQYIAAPLDAGQEQQTHEHWDHRVLRSTQSRGQRKRKRGPESPLHAAHNRTETQSTTHTTRRLYVHTVRFARFAPVECIVVCGGVRSMLPLRRTTRGVSDGPIPRAHFTSYTWFIEPGCPDDRTTGLTLRLSGRGNRDAMTHPRARRIPLTLLPLFLTGIEFAFARRALLSCTAVCMLSAYRAVYTIQRSGAAAGAGPRWSFGFRFAYWVRSLPPCPTRLQSTNARTPYSNAS